MAKTETPSGEIGAPAPDFDLPAVDGRRYCLADVRGKNGLVMAFICNHCPYVKAVIGRLVDDLGMLAEKGIGAAAIMPNDGEYYPEDSFDNMMAFARRHRFSFPYMMDADQKTARAYGAVCTPDIFGYNGDLRLQYRGRIDDSGMGDASSAKRELLEAMTMVATTGHGPDVQVASIGCSIKWKNMRKV